MKKETRKPGNKEKEQNEIVQCWVGHGCWTSAKIAGTKAKARARRKARAKVIEKESPAKVRRAKEKAKPTSDLPATNHDVTEADEWWTDQDWLHGSWESLDGSGRTNQVTHQPSSATILAWGSELAHVDIPDNVASLSDYTWKDQYGGGDWGRMLYDS